MGSRLSMVRPRTDWPVKSSKNLPKRISELRIAKLQVTLIRIEECSARGFWEEYCSEPIISDAVLSEWDKLCVQKQPSADIFRVPHYFHDTQLCDLYNERTFASSPLPTLLTPAGKRSVATLSSDGSFQQ